MSKDAMLTRRCLLKTAASASVTGLLGCSSFPAVRNRETERLSGAIGFPNGLFGVGRFSTNGDIDWLSHVEARCHSGCQRPRKRDLLFFERRPGWAFYVFNGLNGERLQKVKPQEGEHFVGHGTFSPDGRYLYVTANQYHEGAGVIGVYDAEHSYQRVATLDLDGIGPHEIVLHPDGNTLVIALGGILTHPDYGRVKLNLDTMEPALILMDRNTGEIVGRYSPPHHHQSVRHVSVNKGWQVFIAFQYQGARYDTPALLATVQKGRLQEYRFDIETQASLANYIASVVAHPENSLVAATSPIGSTVIVFNGDTGDLVAKANLADCAGDQAIQGGDFLVSSGSGHMLQLSAHHPVKHIKGENVFWDHHLF